MDIVMLLLCIAGLSFAIGQVPGPFGAFTAIRGLIARIPVVGEEIRKLMSCDFCLGFWVSAGVCFLTQPFNWQTMALWSFGGAIFNSLAQKLIAKWELGA